LIAFDYFILVSDFSIAMAMVIGFTNTYKSGKLSTYYYKLFWIGCLIGSTWEFTFLFLGPEFLHSVKEWPFGLGGWPRKLSHSIWDGGLFMVGVYFCLKYLQGPHFYRFSWNALGIMLSWGIFQELLVEYLFNGRVWVYEPLSWNPGDYSTFTGLCYRSGLYTDPSSGLDCGTIYFLYFLFEIKTD